MIRDSKSLPSDSVYISRIPLETRRLSRFDGATGSHLNYLTSTLFSAPVYKTYGGLIADEKFEPAGFAASLGYKDIRLALTAAEELRVPMPLASLLRDRLLSLLAQGGEKLDWSALARLAAKDAGLVDRRE